MPIFSETTIIDKPIKFTQHRVDLTKKYRLEHYGINSNSIQIIPKMIVIHWTAHDKLDPCFRTFDNEELPKGARPTISKSSPLGVSAHFLVDRDGTIYRLMPETWMARHCIGLNNCAIGIENIGGANNQENLTALQLKANRELVRYLKNRYPTIKHLIGHYEYLQYKNTPLWLEKDPSYHTAKSDPGVKFMTNLRQQVRDLNLLKSPTR
ncbi:MAG: peptidoglycan recognition protein family protein [Chlamydiota bacterium]